MWDLFSAAVGVWGRATAALQCWRRRSCEAGRVVRLGALLLGAEHLFHCGTSLVTRGLRAMTLVVVVVMLRL